MKLSELVDRESVLVPLGARNATQAIASLVDALPVPARARDLLRKRMLEREAAGSTGIGCGVALPHALCPGLAEPVVAVGRAATPLDFKSPDGAPVTLAFAVATPERDPSCHLYPLASLSLLPMDGNLLERLNRASTPEALYAALARINI